MNDTRREPFESRAKQAVVEAGLTYQQVGERMGYPASSARQAVYQFIKGPQPSVGKLILFATAIGIPPEDLL